MAEGDISIAIFIWLPGLVIPRLETSLPMTHLKVREAQQKHE